MDGRAEQREGQSAESGNIIRISEFGGPWILGDRNKSVGVEST